MIIESDKRDYRLVSELQMTPEILNQMAIIVEF